VRAPFHWWPKWHGSSRGSASMAIRTGPDDIVFPGDGAGHLDASALRRRFVAARDATGLRPLRFHDLRHTFGSLAINRASIVQVQAWMGHADAKTTMATCTTRAKRTRRSFSPTRFVPLEHRLATSLSPNRGPQRSRASLAPSHG
jgi:integrase